MSEAQRTEDSLESDGATALSISLFIRSDHIEEAWRIVDPLLEGTEKPDAAPPQIYDTDSWGPETADGLLSQNGHSWQRVCGCHGGSDG